MALYGIGYLDFEVTDLGYNQQEYVDANSLSPFPGRTIDTLTTHGDNANTRCVIGLSLPQERGAIAICTGLRVVIADAELENLRVTDINVVPSVGMLGLATYAELTRFGSSYEIVSITQLPFSPGDVIRQHLPVGGVAKAFIDRQGSRDDEVIDTVDRLVGRQKREYELARDVFDVLGPVTTH